jgi:hypothetical protein
VAALAAEDEDDVDGGSEPRFCNFWLLRTRVVGVCAAVYALVAAVVVVHASSAARRQALRPCQVRLDLDVSCLRDSRQSEVR